MKCLLLLLFLFLPGSLFCQEAAIRFLDDFRHYEQIHSTISDRTINSYAQIEGSPYLYPEYKDADILTRDSITYRGKLRYDMYADEMEYQVNGKTYWIATKENIAKILLNGRTFVYLKEQGKKKSSYYELLVDGPCQLLGKYSVAFKEKEKAKPYQETKPAHFQHNRNLYYLRKNDGTMKLISNKKTIINFLQDKRDDITNYMKHNRVSINKITDLEKLVNYYNNL